MRLRGQLIAVSLVALLLPWAGCEYVAEMERTLRDGEQDMLGKFAGSVAAYIEGKDELHKELRQLDAVPGAQSFYLHTEKSLIVDGYLDDELDPQIDVLRLGKVDEAQVDVYLSAFGDRVYVYLGFNLPSLQKRRVSSVDPSEFDHVELVVGSPENQRRLLLISEGAGEFTAYRMQASRLVEQYSATGYWLDDADGYQLEMAFPRSWLQGYFGIRVFDASFGRTVSSLAASGEPAPVYMRSENLEAELRHFSSKVDVLLVDTNGWIRARKDGAELQQQVDRPPGFWLLESGYRWLMNLQFEQQTYVPPAAGRLNREEIDIALRSAAGGAAGWYVMEDDGETAIVTSAIRIRNKAGNPLGVAVLETSGLGSRSRSSSTLVEVLGVSALVMVAIVLLLVGYATWLSLRISRLSNQVMTVMEPKGRELKEFPPQTAGDEIGRLGRNFGRLLGRVRGYTDYLRSLASKLSHELRTPLAVVSSSLDNLEHEDLSPKARDYLERARGGSNRLTHILTALSEASRVEQAIESAERVPTDLVELVRQVVSGYRTAWPEQAIETELPEEPVKIEACPELIAQLLDKLMDNARDFCPADGVVLFSVAVTTEGVALLVENDGPPLPEGMEEQMFESMVSVREGKAETVHLGLGLTVVRLIAEFHGGKVRAENRGDGGGVRFEIRLPAAQ